METDDVVNYNVDVLFELLHVWPYPLPISPRHPDDPQNYGHFMKQHNVPKRTTPYIHAHVIWNYRAKPFLQNLRSLLQQGNFQGANFDETAVNVMLWKAGANHTVCKYGKKEFIRTFFSKPMRTKYYLVQINETNLIIST
jgi:hypothetical protein